MEATKEEKVAHIKKYGNSSMYAVAKSIASYNPMSDKQGKALDNIYRATGELTRKHRSYFGDGPSSDGDCYNMDPSYMGNPYGWE